MPRTVRRVTRSRKRQTKWCGFADGHTIPNAATLGVADGDPICPATTSKTDQADPLVGWCRGSLSVSRIGIGEVNPAVMWAVVMGRVVPTSNQAIQTFNPFLTEDLERQDILGMGAVAVPPTVLIPSSDVNVANRGSLTTEINIKVGRRYHRNLNQLFLWVVAAGAEDNAYQVQVVIRSLMKFG